MSTPEKPKGEEEKKKDSPTSVIEGPGAGVDPLTRLRRILDEHEDIQFSENYPGIFFAWSDCLMEPLLQIAGMPFDSPFLAGLPPPLDKAELARRIVVYCLHGAGMNLENSLIFKLTTDQILVCGEAIGMLRVDPYIQALQAAVGGPIMLYYSLTSREQVSDRHVL